MEADESWRTSEALRQFKRAAIALVAVAAFWLWLLFGSAGFIAGIFQSPKALVVAFYAGAVLVLVSLLVALTAVMVLLANWPDKSQREAAYRATLQATSGAADFVLQGFRSKTRMVRSGGRLRPNGLSLHSVRAYVSGRLPGLRAEFLAGAGRITGRGARSVSGRMRQAIGVCQSFAARRMPGLESKDVFGENDGPLPRAEGGAPIQNPAAVPTLPAPASTSIRVRRPPAPSRPPASAAVPQPLPDQRDITS
ncbi:MAG TPA: hypothetical protein VHH13_11070 [Arthrobacter sp.]|nr:hypothetical protein [Arthrobacter sp.]